MVGCPSELETHGAGAPQLAPPEVAIHIFFDSTIGKTTGRYWSEAGSVDRSLGMALRCRNCIFTSVALLNLHCTPLELT